MVEGACRSTQERVANPQTEQNKSSSGRRASTARLFGRTFRATGVQLSALAAARRQLPRTAEVPPRLVISQTASTVAPWHPSIGGRPSYELPCARRHRDPLRLP